MARQSEPKTESRMKRRIVQISAAVGSASLIAGIAELARRRWMQRRPRTLAARLHLRT
jgi:hypothetical protein